MVQSSIRDVIAVHGNFPSDESLGYVDDVLLGRCKCNEVVPELMLLVSSRTPRELSSADCRWGRWQGCQCEAPDEAVCGWGRSTLSGATGP